MTKQAAPAFSTERSREVLELACREVDLPSDSAELVRLGENAIYRLPESSTVVRIARSAGYWNDVVKEVRVARWLAAHGIPAGTVLDDLPQPLDVDGHPVSFWHLVPGRRGEDSDAPGLARLLRRIHATPPPTGLPSQDVFARVQARIQSAPIRDEDRDFLVDMHARLRDEVSTLRFKLPKAPVHGDAHTKNLIVGSDGPVLIDFEAFAFGQPEWDLVVFATGARLGWRPMNLYQSFSTAYGFDIMRWDGFDVLEVVQRFKMTTWLMQMVEESPEIARQHYARMHTLRTGEIAQPWEPF